MENRTYVSLSDIFTVNNRYECYKRYYGIEKDNDFCAM